MEPADRAGLAVIVNSVDTNIFSFQGCAIVSFLSNKNFIVSCVLLFISSCFFYYINSNIKPLSEWTSLKYTSGDSTGYLHVGQWLIGENDFLKVKDSVVIRPFFYPLIVAILEKINPWAIIIFQFILWESQVLIVYFCGILISKSKKSAFILSLFCITLISPIGISLHILTETTASFLLVSSFFFVICYTVTSDKKFIFYQIFAISLCSVVKPVYFYLFLSNVFLHLCLPRRKSIIEIFVLIIVTLPIIFQLSIMRSNFYINKISFIDTIAVNDYFLSKLAIYKKHMENHDDYKEKIHSIRAGRRKVFHDIINRHGYAITGEIVKKELVENIKKYPIDSFRLFIDLVIENSKQPSFFLFSANYNMARLFFLVSLCQSEILRAITILSLLISLFTFLRMRKHLKHGDIILNISFALAIYITYIASGVTFWQGDRFLVPIYFIGILYLFNNIVFIFDKNKNMQ
ncbi:hypothetical protein VU06_00810 [Desulfobulbus sp. F3]|nr:hypothetical protein [Desulfobulbus sp. F3]